MFSKIIIFSLSYLVLFFTFQCFASQIHNAARQGDLNTIKNMVEQDQKLVNSKDDRDCVPLHYASDQGHLDIVNFLLDNGADINAKDVDGDTPLHWAAYAGQEKVVNMLLANKADTKLLNKRGWTALFWAVVRGHTELVKLFLDKGLKEPFVDNEQISLLHYAAYNGRTEAAKLLISNDMDVNIQDIRGDTPLHGAAWSGHSEVIRLLKTKGIKMDIKNTSGKTALDYAICRSNWEVRNLLNADKDLSHKDMDIKLTKLTPGEAQTDIAITILYDNYLFTEGTKPDWGFACLIEGMEKTILFDTGTKPEILWHNISTLGVDINKVKQIVISHNHGDHTGGLLSILQKNHNIQVYLPYSSPYNLVRNIEQTNAQFLALKDPVEICKNAYLTGEMGDHIKEQSLILNSKKGLVIITGCSHPGIENIVQRTKDLINKDIYLVFGGFHLMQHSDQEIQNIIQDFKNLGVQKCGPSHCTGDKAINLFRQAYLQNYVKLGTGLKFKISQ